MTIHGKCISDDEMKEEMTNSMKEHIKEMLQNFEEMQSVFQGYDYVIFMQELAKEAKERSENCLSNLDLEYFISESVNREGFRYFEITVYEKITDREIEESGTFYDKSDALQWLEVNYPDAEEI